MFIHGKIDDESFVKPQKMGAVVKQVLPVPDYLTIMIVDIDKEGYAFYRDYRDLLWPYLLALVEFEDGENEVVAYNAAINRIDKEAEILGKRKCPRCGKEMRIEDRKRSLFFSFHCTECGYTDDGIPEK